MLAITAKSAFVDDGPIADSRDSTTYRRCGAACACEVPKSGTAAIRRQSGPTASAHLRTLTHRLYRQKMDGPVAPLVVGILVAGRTIFALFSGSASADNKGLLREDEPMIYWLVIAMGLVGSIVLFATAYHLRNGS